MSQWHFRDRAGQVQGPFGDEEMRAWYEAGYLAPDLFDVHIPHIMSADKGDRRAVWGESPLEEREIFEVFARFLEGAVPYLPWSESRARETSEISAQLVELNRRGFLTINSQPRVEGVSSEHPTFGWGEPGGVVYQKAYIEFFVSPVSLARLVEEIDSGRRPTLTYTYAFAHSDEVHTNSIHPTSPCTVTWGVFRDSEIVAPTVCDPSAFLAWKLEAFDLWLSDWATIYPEDSSSYDLIRDMHDTYALVNVVDNDFQNGTLFSAFDALR